MGERLRHWLALTGRAPIPPARPARSHEERQALRQLRLEAFDAGVRITPPVGMPASLALAACRQSGFRCREHEECASRRLELDVTEPERPLCNDPARLRLRCPRPV